MVELVFYFFAFLMIFSGLMVITLRNPVHAVLFLIFAFFNAAGLFILLGAEFIAMTLIIVYVGAVAVLFLFVVMMLDINLDKLREGFWKWFPFGALIAVVIAVEIGLVMMGDQFKQMIPLQPKVSDYSNTKELGRLIYTEYVYVFELAAVVLLVAMVAAIALTLRHRTDKKSPNPSSQVKVKRNDRIRMVSMAPETKE